MRMPVTFLQVSLRNMPVGDRSAKELHSPKGFDALRQDRTLSGDRLDLRITEDLWIYEKDLKYT